MRLLLLDAARRRKEQVDLVRLPLDAARSHLHDVNMQVLGDRRLRLGQLAVVLERELHGLRAVFHRLEGSVAGLVQEEADLADDGAAMSQFRHRNRAVDVLAERGDLAADDVPQGAVAPLVLVLQKLRDLRSNVCTEAVLGTRASILMARAWILKLRSGA